MEQGPFCQSCGMPLSTPELYGTEANDEKTSEYCTYCYKKGAFVQPDITMKEMQEQCIPFMVKEGMSEAKARELMDQYLPHLRRWKK